MKIVTNQQELKKIPILDRPNCYFDESLTATWPIQDNHEPLVDVEKLVGKQKAKILFAPAPGEPESTLLRRQCARRLLQAAKQVSATSHGRLMLKITSSFRPLYLQRKYFEQIRKEIAARESLTAHRLWKKVTQFIADPNLCPPHTTGGAVDCTIVRQASRQELFMGTPVNDISQRAQTWYPRISRAAKKNRQILYQAMTSAGFVNLATEWWHYSYGDQYWAVFHSYPHALYDKMTS